MKKRKLARAIDKYKLGYQNPKKQHKVEIRIDSQLYEKLKPYKRPKSYKSNQEGISGFIRVLLEKYFMENDNNGRV